MATISTSSSSKEIVRDSSYFAAELRMSIEDANDLAEGLGLPIRFAEQG